MCSGLHPSCSGFDKPFLQPNSGEPWWKEVKRSKRCCRPSLQRVMISVWYVETMSYERCRKLYTMASYHSWYILELRIRVSLYINFCFPSFDETDRGMNSKWILVYNSLVCLRWRLILFFFESHDISTIQRLFYHT